MSPLESLFFYSMTALLIIGLLLICYRIDQLEKEKERLLKENHILKMQVHN